MNARHLMAIATWCYGVSILLSRNCCACSVRFRFFLLDIFRFENYSVNFNISYWHCLVLFWSFEQIYFICFYFNVTSSTYVFNKIGMEFEMRMNTIRTKPRLLKYF